MKSLLVAVALVVGMLGATTGAAVAYPHHGHGWGHGGGHHERHCGGWGWHRHHERFCRHWD